MKSLTPENLLDELRSVDQRRREMALFRLMANETPTSPIQLAVTQLLTDSTPYLRELAAETLFSFRCNLPEIKQQILDAINDPSPIVRENLIRLLLNYSDDEQTRRIATALLEDDQEIVQIRSAQLLWRFTKELTRITPVIQRGLMSLNSHCRAITCQLLAEIKVEASAFVPLLIQLTRDLVGSVRLNALLALSKCCSMQDLIKQRANELLEDSDVAVRAYALGLTARFE